MQRLPRRSVLRGLTTAGIAAAIGTGLATPNATAAPGHAPDAVRTGGLLPASDPGNTGGWHLDPAFTDDFQGRFLDPDKWYDHITYWEGRAPSYFDPSNVRILAGRAVIPFKNLNAVRNPAFQNGVTDWQVPGAGVQTIYEGSISPSALRLDPGAWARQTVTGLLPNTHYRLTAYWRVATDGVGTFGVSGYDTGDGTTLTVTNPDLAVATIDFRTDLGSRSATVSLHNAGSTGTVDVTLVAIVDIDADDPPIGSYFSTGAIQSRVQAHYGYYEVKAKVADSSSTSSFWFQGSESEIDVMEIIGDSTLDPTYGTMMPMNLHYFPGGWANDQAFPVQYDTGVRLADDFHVFGLDWQPDTIRFYFDGTLVRTHPNDYWHEPEYLFLDSEAFLWFGFPTPESLPSTYQIEYVRAWKH